MREAEGEQEDRRSRCRLGNVVSSGTTTTKSEREGVVVELSLD